VTSICLRPQARDDRRQEVRYYRDQAGPSVAERFVREARKALEQIRLHPFIGSPRIGHELNMQGLRAWRLNVFPAAWFYIVRDDHVDVIRLLGERQDLSAHLQNWTS
jgi:toxin ParE1/3/4